MVQDLDGHSSGSDEDGGRGAGGKGVNLLGVKQQDLLMVVFGCGEVVNEIKDG